MKSTLSDCLKRITLLAAMLSLPLTAGAEVFTGKLNGYTCVSHGVVCPTEKLDPHLAVETDFVLMLKDGDYLFLPNLRRDIKVRYALDTVQIDGTKHPRFNAIEVDVLRVMKGDLYVTVWSQDDEDFSRRAMRTVMPGYEGI